MECHLICNANNYDSISNPHNLYLLLRKVHMIYLLIWSMLISTTYQCCIIVLSGFCSRNPHRHVR